ncbi:hypothetical protein ACIB24_06915 [Spongisporangium articulatum]|uniref:Membrane protein involved in the export of O-antigen and teichoic acid n=1 Tax=Spongisporangium articulatum TaxID=3362603 RepID=A0ABW8AKA7_9ACTN
MAGDPDVVLAETANEGGGNGRRVLWTFADQALSSLTNFAVTIVVAREVGADAFGAFALALLTFSFVIGLGRAIIGDPYVIRFSASDPAEAHEATRQATGGAFLYGLVAGLVCLVAALVVPDADTSGGLLALAFCLPGMLVQDTWRFVFFAARRPAAATMSDLLWAVLQFTLLGVLIRGGHESVFLLTLSWGLSATASAVLGIWQARAVPAVGSGFTWFRRTSDLNVRMGADFAFNQGFVNLAMYAVTGILGLVATGALRGAQTLLGPLNLFRSGLDSFVLPMMARRAAQGRSLLGLVTATSAPATAVTAAWVVILFVLPDRWGRELFGASWDGAHTVMLGIGVVSLAQGVVLGASLGLKALRRADLLLKVTTWQAPGILLAGVVGAWGWGALGAAYGFGIAQACGSVLCWYWFYRADTAPRDWASETA